MERIDRQVQLPDGRKLGYSEFGDPNGFPVINNHGGLLCRLDITPADEPAKELGVRIISPDRPGIGLSDPKVGRTLLDWADDVKLLADQLELKQFGVIGWSMGGQYALACAYQLPDRVSAAAVMAGAVPLDSPNTFDELTKLDQRFTRLSQHAPKAAEAIFFLMGELAEHAPQTWNTIMSRSIFPIDSEAIHRQPLPGVAGFAAPALLHAKGMVEEYCEWVRPWGFSFEQIHCAVMVWQGDADELVPRQWAEEMARRIPHARLHLIAGEGHLLPYNHYKDILSELIQESDKSQ
ncbi:MAG: alpha/beta hydrolase [Methanothrix sp.]|nr:alpha/beta hydrolase [Methanothrix sp.]